MKTKFLLLTIFTLTLTGCQEDEFYEKDYIDTVKDQYERANLPDEDSNYPDSLGYLPPEEDNADNSGNTGGGDAGSGDNGNGDNGGGDNNSPNLRDQQDSFSQSATGGKLDILWVIDNSGSMGDEQQALGDNFDAFITEFVNKNIDFQMAVTTTDTRNRWQGLAMGDSQEALTSDKLAENKDLFLSKFAENVNVGIRGSGYEKGIKASYAYTNRYSEWMREDAYYVVVYMSDEEDQSEASVTAYMNAIKGTKTNDGLVKAYSIVQMVESTQNGAIARGYQRYKEASDLTNGEVADIRDDFYLTLLNMGEQISSLAEQFPLSKVPYAAKDLVVKVDGIVSTEWEYVEATNSIKFNLAPADGSQITIDYQYQ